MEKQYPLHQLSTWRIGGPAEVVYWPETMEDLSGVWKRAKEAGIPIWLVGRGSNLLFPDEGLPGLTLVTTGMRKIHWGNYIVRVEAGYSLALLAQEVGERGWSGLEFARGIPGSVGGAVIMNAGAHGCEIASLIKNITLLDRDGNLKILKREDVEFAYRSCSLRDLAWVLEVQLGFSHGDRELILKEMKDNLAKRSENQPLEKPNAGSIFRNPPGDSAGRLIEEAGWKGKRIGGAQVSEKHANFIINTGKAMSTEVLALIEGIIQDVRAKYGITLQTEVVRFQPENHRITKDKER